MAWTLITPKVLFMAHTNKGKKKIIYQNTVPNKKL